MNDIANQLEQLGDVKKELRKLTNSFGTQNANDKDGFKSLVAKLREASATKGIELELSEDGTYYKLKKGINTSVSGGGYEIIIPPTKNGIPIKTIEKYAFGEQYYTFSCPHLYLPETIEILKTQCFDMLQMWTQGGGTSKIVLPKSVKRIEENVVGTFGRVAHELYIMSNAEEIYIHPKAFWRYSSSDNNSFNYINVAWSEGEVEGAPWGATNAVIRYNVKYTGGEY